MLNMLRDFVADGWSLIGALALVLASSSCASNSRVGLIPLKPGYSLGRTESSSAPSVHLLVFEVNYSYDLRGNYVKTTHAKYRILDEAAVENWGTLEADWSPWFQAKPELSAVVVDPEGKSHTLDPRTIVEGPAEAKQPNLFTDGKVVRAPLPGVRVGSVIETHTTYRTTRPEFESGMTVQVPVAAPWPIDSLRVVVEVPEAVPLRYQLLDAAVTVSDTRAKGRHRVEFRGGPIKKTEALEPLQPPEVSSWPSVAFSTGESWSAVARAFHKLSRQQLLDRRVEATARAAIAGARTDQEKIDRLLAWQRAHVRYADIEFGGASIVPGYPADTLQRGYGDCKDQATLLGALLHSVGIQSQLVLVRSGGEDLLPELPGLGGFNHALLYLPGPPALWVDPTSSTSRAGLLPFFEQGRLALVIDPSTTDLIRTPTTKASENVYHEERELRFAEEGLGKVVETTTAGGAMDQLLRLSYSERTQAAIQATLDKYVRQEYRSTKPAKLELSAASRLEAPFRVTIGVQESGILETLDVEAVAFLDPGSALTMVPNALRYAQERRTPMLVPVPHRAEVRYRLIPPAGFVVQELPKATAVESKAGTLQGQYRSLPNGEVEAVFRLDLLAPRLSAEQVNAFRKVVSTYDDPQWVEVRFDHAGVRLVKEGKAREGYELFRQTLERGGSARDWRRYALALAQGTDLVAARKAAAKAVDLEPGQAVNHRTLGYLRLQDDLGRFFYPGYERAAAITALKKALEIDPTDDLARVNLALAYEYSKEGNRYADRADLEAAVAEYLKIDPQKIKSLSGEDYSANPLIALLRLERFGQVIERLRSAKTKDKTTSYALIAALAASQGVARALEDASHLGLSAVELTDALDTASGYLAQLRRYPEALGLVQAAARLASDPSKFKDRLAILPKYKRADSLGDKSAEEIARKALWTLSAKDRLDDASLSGLFAQRVSKGKERELIDAFQIALRRAIVNNAVRSEVWGDEFFADAAVGAMQATVEPHPPIADLVKLGAPNSLQTEFLVVREAGAHRVLTIGDVHRGTCLGGADAVRRGDLEAARRWLAWARSLAETKAVRRNFASEIFLPVWRKDGTSDAKTAIACWCGALTHPPEEILGWLTDSLNRTRDAKAKEAVAQALANTLLAASQPARALETTTKSQPARSESWITRSLHCRALLALNRFNECRSLSQAHLASHPQDGDAVLQIAHAEALAGRLDAARAALKRYADAGHSDPSVLGDFAWFALLLGAPGPQDLDFALRATQSTDHHDTRALLVLALVYAELGKPQEAIQSARQASDTGYSLDKDLMALVLGRVAQAHGLNDTARSLYGRVEKSASDSPVSAYRLAQSWLSRLPKP